MISNIALLRWITLFSVLAWLIIYWQGGKKIIVDIQTSLRANNSRLDTILLIIISLCSFMLTVLIFLATLGWTQIISSPSVVILFAGTLLVIIGIWGMFYCRRHLGRLWTAETNISKDHQIIDTGPYHFIRHPIYTFALVMYIGLALVFPSVWSAILVGIISAAYILKTKDEDAFLEKNLSGYQEYKLRVRFRLFPGVW